MDASVAAKWVVAEEHSAQAATLLNYDALYAPDHWQAEAANVVWSKVRFGGLAAQDAEARVDLLLRAPVQTVRVALLMKQAFALSVENGITIYDSLYIAMAHAEGIPFVTADARLLRKVTGTASRRLMQWVGDLPLPG